MIKVKLDLVMRDRGVTLIELAEKVGITHANMSLLKNGKVKGIRFETLERICQVLNCQPGDILEYDNE
jgi:putative transcriptional regulator